ncbi:MAG: hypothetical protein ACEQSH_00100 [Bacteroidia bacterium]
MRYVPLKTVMITVPGAAEPGPFRYSDAIVGIINASSAEKGLPLSEISKSLRVLEPVEAAAAAGKDSVALEDSDWEHLNRMVSQFSSWRIIHRAVANFVEDIATAPQTEGGTPSPAAPAAPASRVKPRR